MRYNNYHRHTCYSNIATPDSVAKPIDYINRAKELGHTTYFTTEHGWGGDVFSTYTLCEKEGIKPIFGAEAYMVMDNQEKKGRGYHIVLIAMTNNGRKQINKIISQANTEGFYYHARIDLPHLLTLNRADVVVTSACIAGMVGKGETWREEWFDPIFEHFGDHFFLEVQDHNHPAQIKINKEILKVSRETGCKIIHGCDSHYIYSDRKNNSDKGRKIYLAAKGMDYGDESTFVLDYPDSDTILERYKEQGVLTREQAIEALENTLIFDRAEPIMLDKEIKLPNLWQESPTKHLKRILLDEFKEKVVSRNLPKEELDKYKQALQEEFQTIKDCKMENYFLMNYYIVKRAKEKGAVLTRSGRGSAVSFLTNYLLGFTEIDRLRAVITLYPSRFMSATRILKSKSLPDIDLNWYQVEEVIQASKEYLGEDGVYWMVAYKPMQEASAFRTWCRGLGLEINDYDPVAKDLESYRDDPKWGPLIKDSEEFVGVVDSIAPSPCSVLLYDKPISEEIGLIKVGNEICCCIDGYNSDVFKYVKNDYLRVQVWGLISKTYKMLGKPIDGIGQLVNSCDDDVWNLFGSGLTTTINQCDSDYDKQILKQYKPKNLAELAMYVAAIRPGFKSMLQNFVERKPYTTGVKELDDLLKDSFHYLAYQENIMTYLSWLGIPESETYDIIKKISKKKFKGNELEELESKLHKSWMEKFEDDHGFWATWQAVQDSASYSFNACVSGDTIITSSVEHANGGYNHLSVGQLYQYQKKHGNLPLLYADSLGKDGLISCNNVVGIYYSGKRPVFKVTLENGLSITCTYNHKFPTPKGKDKRVTGLRVGDELFISTNKYVAGNNLYYPETAKILSIKFQGLENTYDIEMKAPNHNLAVNGGIITSNSHSLSVGIDALYGAYLKAKFPLEYFCVALNEYSKDSTRTDNLTKELNNFGITLEAPTFRYSRAGYWINKDNHSIIKGIGSIKSMNEDVGEQLYALRDNKYEHFVDLLVDLGNTALKKNTLDILIKINYFKEFGNPNVLLKYVQVYNMFIKRKTINLAQTEQQEKELGIPTGSILRILASLGAEIKPNSKIIKEYDKMALIKKICVYYKGTKTTHAQHVKYDIEALGYTQFIDPNASKRLYCIVQIEGKSKTKTIQLHEVYSGKARTVRAWASSLRDGHREMECGDLILISDIKRTPKKRPTGEVDPRTGKQKWEAAPELGMETWLGGWSFTD